HGIILEGGDVVNSIPDRCKIRYEIRSTETDYYNEVTEKVINCAKAAALATGCKLEYNKFERVCLGLKRNKTLAEIFKSKMNEFGIVDNQKQLCGGSTDMGDVSHIIPSLHPMIKFVENNEDVHTKEFLASSIKPYAFNMLINSAKTLAMTALEILKNPQ
ncbi:M20 family peptidase, partial [Clostridioides difficile]|nr:M20 family peptidase [Clostridioides difficile]